MSLLKANTYSLQRLSRRFTKVIALSPEDERRAGLEGKEMTSSLYNGNHFSSLFLIIYFLFFIYWLDLIFSDFSSLTFFSSFGLMKSGGHVHELENACI